MSETKAPKAKAAAKPKTKAAAVPAGEQTTASVPTSTVIIKGKAVPTRGRSFTGIVISNRMNKSVTVEWERRKYVPKYQRYEKRRTRVKAHDEHNAAQVGDTVEIVETRPISKTKNFLLTRIITRATE